MIILRGGIEPRRLIQLRFNSPVPIFDFRLLIVDWERETNIVLHGAGMRIARGRTLDSRLSILDIIIQNICSRVKRESCAPLCVVVLHSHDLEKSGEEILAGGRRMRGRKALHGCTPPPPSVIARGPTKQSRPGHAIAFPAAAVGRGSGAQKRGKPPSLSVLFHTYNYLPSDSTLFKFFLSLGYIPERKHGIYDRLQQSSFDQIGYQG